MSQKLTMPFHKSMMLCGYKNPKYRSYWGYNHYGIDISTRQGGASDDHTVVASGEGKVVAAGWDSKLGGAVAIVYTEAENHKTGEVRDLTARYMHMEQVLVKAGDTVKRGTPIGIEGKEGTGDYHLHLEFDTDTKYTTWTPQVSRGLSFWHHGLDSTVNPSDVLHVADGYCLVEPTYNPDWLNSEDFSIPYIDLKDSESCMTLTDLMAHLKEMGIEYLKVC